ncbi:DNA gyrase inhibitor YacG [Cognatishimia sp. SS12]|uniref:DNA gyrase inhibitor YacG n=1 Tax=Cognatishimia sp. SS12 TaxID=2979465 RepID=UPI00232C3756|nr:DNA gyrase inhibitor YacG [Cognatishimia sp. SS12]MDC0738943.1 DNA gyrase inhibitor YacG [Cognatishimia sp. SS12]
MSCPICKKPAEKHYRPFCSKRCADIDLGKWFGEEYAVPTADQDGLEEAFEGAIKKDIPLQ